MIELPITALLALEMAKEPTRVPAIHYRLSTGLHAHTTHSPLAFLVISSSVLLTHSISSGKEALCVSIPSQQKNTKLFINNTSNKG